MLPLNSKELAFAAKNKTVEAQYYLASKKHTRKKACDWYLEAAKQGHILAMYKLGQLYEQWCAEACYATCPARFDMKGYLRKLNSQSLKWYKNAAAKGYAPAMYALGGLYHTGRGSIFSTGQPDDILYRVNYKKAAKFYHLAAMQGHSQAQYTLAEMFEYQYQEVFKPNIVQDFFGSLKRMLLGLISAIFSKSKRGKERKVYSSGVEAKNKTLLLYTLSAEQENPDAQHALGRLYEAGKLVQQDYEQAQKWYIRAAENGNTSSSYRLGQMYEQGIGCRKNIITAVKWYKMNIENSDDSEPDEYQSLEDIGSLLQEPAEVDPEELERIKAKINATFLPNSNQ